MERVTQEELDADLLLADLVGEPLEDTLVLVRGGAPDELIAELLGELLLEPVGEPVVHPLGAAEAEGPAELFGFAAVHTYQQPAYLSSALEVVNMITDFPPAAKVEVPNTKVGPLRLCERVLESWEETFVDVIEDPWQGSVFRMRYYEVGLEMILAGRGAGVPDGMRPCRKMVGRLKLG